MKKIKFLPTILMLVLCTSVLAVGIFALTPSKNDVDGIIAVKGVNTPVSIEVFIDNTSVAFYDEVRTGVEINLSTLINGNNLLKFDMSQVNTLDEVTPKTLTLRLTILDKTKHL